MTSALVISARDNVATALEALEPGHRLEVAGRRVTVRDRIPAGHKVALAAIAIGQEVLKYGSAIGTATADIAEGAHVHTHNVASNRGRGDLSALGALGASGASGAGPFGALDAPAAPAAPDAPDAPDAPNAPNAPNAPEAPEAPE